MPALTYDGRAAAPPRRSPRRRPRAASRPWPPSSTPAASSSTSGAPTRAQVASVGVATDKARTAAIYRRPEQGLRGPGLQRPRLGAAPRPRGAAAGRHPDRARRRGRRRGRRQRRLLGRRGPGAGGARAPRLARRRRRQRATARRSSPATSSGAKFETGGLLLDTPALQARRRPPRRAGRGRVPRAHRRRDARRRGQRDRRHRRRDGRAARGRARRAARRRHRTAGRRTSSPRATCSRSRAGVPHQFTDVSDPFLYFVVKVEALTWPPPTTLDLAARLPGPPELLPGRPGRDRRPADRRGRRARRRGSGATPTRGSRRSTSSSSATPRGPARPGHRARTAPTTCCPTPRPPTTTTRAGGCSRPRRRCAASRTAACASTGTGSTVTIPERVGDLDPTGATVVFEVVIDDYAEVWVDGAAAARARRHRRPGRRRLQRAEPRRAHARRAAGPDVPDRRVRHQRPDLGLAAQLHLDAHGDARLLRRRARARSRGDPASSDVDADLDAHRCPPDARARARRRRLRVHRGPGLGARRRAALQLAEHERDLPLDAGRPASTVFRSKSGYTGVDIGRYHQPGSNGLDLRPARPADDVPARQPPRHPVNPHGDIDRARRPLRGQAAQQPERPRLPLRRHAVLHRPAVRAAGRVRRPRARSSTSAASSACATARCAADVDELAAGPNGLAFSPDERCLYVGNWDLERKVVMRYDSRRRQPVDGSSCSST